MPAHVLVETYSVLTRLPPPHRAPASIVAEFLVEWFEDPPLVLPPRAHVRLVEEAASTAISGGSIHDALIAATVRHAKARLLTRDRRAVVVYEKLGIDFEIVG